MSAESSEPRKAFYTSSLWTFFIFCLFWTSVQGRYHLIGSSEPIVAAPGDDVILPCRVYPGWNAERKTVEWSKPDLKADPSGGRRGVEYVFVYRFQSPDRDIMMASYVQRTSLSSEGLKHGDLSLRLRNVTLQDSGRFRCFVPNLKIDTEVLVLVDPNFVSTTPSEPPENRNPISPDLQDETGDTDESRSRILMMVCVSLFCLFCLFVFFIWLNKDPFRCNKEEKSSDPESGASPTVQVLDLETGVCSTVQLLDPESCACCTVQLPCSKAEDGSAGSDQQDSLSCSDIRLDVAPNSRLHG